MADDDWDEGTTTDAPAASYYQPDQGSHKVGRGRGFEPLDKEDNSWGSGSGGSFGSGRRGGGDRGGRGGRGGGRGGGRFGDDDRGGRRENDWTCPDSDCGNSNFGWRRQCQKCNTDKPEGAGGDGGRFGGGGRFDDDSGSRRGGRGGGRGGRNFNNDSDDDNGGSSFGGRGGRGRGDRGDSRNGGDSDDRKKDDWKCPDSDCGNSNFAWRRQCQKCNADRPAGVGGDDGRKKDDWTCPDADCGNSNFAWRRQCQKCNTDRPAGVGGDDGDRPKTEHYIPPEPEDDDKTLYGGGITSGINFDKYDSIKIKVTGNNIPDPIKSFQSAGLRPYVLQNIEKSGYQKPTPVQKNAIPIIMSGRDLMACAQTGSGKTAAFLIPIINTLLEDSKDLMFEGDTCEPQAVIISPTRELTIQIFNEARKFSKNSILKICIAYGGAASQHQASKLTNGCHILVATPGRLNDFVGRGRISFASIRFFVLDEADRMLDMGFLDDMKKMLDHPTMVSTENRQTLMFSATFPQEIQQLASTFMNNYIFAVVGIVGGACADVQQVFYQVARNEKRNKLKELLIQDEDKVLVFVETKRNADFIAVYLSEQKIPTTSIHGDRLQRERETALNDFKYNKMRVLVATAVAARGLDIKGVAHVINYDMPKTIDEYVHRIGRTGRVGNRGKATSFFDSGADSALAPDLVKILQQAGQEVPEWLDSGSFGSGGGFSNYGGHDFRKDTFNSGPQPQAAEEEESW